MTPKGGGRYGGAIASAIDPPRGPGSNIMAARIVVEDPAAAPPAADKDTPGRSTVSFGGSGVLGQLVKRYPALVAVSAAISLATAAFDGQLTMLVLGGLAVAFASIAVESLFHSFRTTEWMGGQSSGTAANTLRRFARAA